DVENPAADRLPVGEVEEVLAVAAVADEDQPGPVPLPLHPEPEPVAVADLLPRRLELGEPLRHAPLVGFPAGDELRIEPDAGVVEEAVAVDVADVDAPDGARLCHFGRRLEVGDPERPGEVVAG